MQFSTRRPPPIEGHIDAGNAGTNRDELNRRADELFATLPALSQQAVKDGHKDGVSPKVAWALKRCERWRAGDERPVVVRERVGAEKPFLAMVGKDGDKDGAVFRVARGA